jgi:hypothetical protein
MNRTIVNRFDMCFGICAGIMFACLGAVCIFQEWMPPHLRIFGGFMLIGGIWGAVIIYRDGG